MNAAIGTTIHCVAAEPYATFMRIGLTDGGQEEVAYEIACVGRLRRGYRILQLRGTLGTRIELSCIFVRLSCGVEPNLWLSARHVRLHRSSEGDRMLQHEEVVERQKETIQSQENTIEQLQSRLSLMRSRSQASTLKVEAEV